MFKTKLRLEEHGTKSFVLTEDLVYEGRDQTFTVPAGFVTDFASVPQFMYWLIPSYGQYTNAAVVHDWLCVQLEDEMYSASFPTHRKTVAPANPVDTDGIFRRIMREEGVPLVRRWLMWTGVRWGAMFSPYRRVGSLSTLFKVLLLSAIELPFLLIPTIFILITLGIDKIMEAS